MADSGDARNHHGIRGFRNRYSAEAHGPSWELLKFLWSMRLARFAQFDIPEIGRVKPEVDWLRTNRSQTSLTWIGHASFLLQIGGLNILTDPHLTARASPLGWAGPKRINAPGLDFADLPPIDLVLVSHNHYDHLDLETVKRLHAEHQPHFIVPLRLKRWFLQQGIHAVSELDWWQSERFKDLNIHCVPVQHFSGRTATDRNQTLWCGFVVQHQGYQALFAGDTGYSRDFADIAARLGPMDLALLPIGAYEPRSFMRPVHVNPEDAVRIHQDLGAKLSVAMHWGTFRLTLEPLDEPPHRLARALDAAKIARDCFLVMQHGETRRLTQGSRGA